MNIKEIRDKLFSKKASDYSVAILFLLVFSIFIAFAIRPSLATAFSLKKQEADLAKIDKLYEDKIINVANIQSEMESNREDLPLLYQAISTTPQVNKMIDDIQQAANENSFLIMKSSVGEVNLLGASKQSEKKILVSIEGESSFDDFVRFTNTLFNQRRLKTVPKVTVSRNKSDQVATDSGKLKIQMDIEGYYL